MLINTQISSKLTFNADNTIKTSFISFMFYKPESNDMVKVMEATYDIARYGPNDTIAYCNEFVAQYALLRVLYSELFYFLIGAGVSIMLVVHIVFNSIIGTLLVGTLIVNIMVIVYMGI